LAWFGQLKSDWLVKVWVLSIQWRYTKVLSDECFIIFFRLYHVYLWFRLNFGKISNVIILSLFYLLWGEQFFKVAGAVPKFGSNIPKTCLNYGYARYYHWSSEDEKLYYLTVGRFRSIKVMMMIAMLMNKYSTVSIKTIMNVFHIWR